MPYPPQLIDQIRTWIQQGYSEIQITQSLKQQGFSDKDIQDMITAARSGVNVAQITEEIKEYIENTTEALIEEKWTEIEKMVEEMNKWKAEINQKIIEMDTKIKDLKENFKNLQDSVVGKIGEYDDHLIKLSSNVKAVEKVFQKIIPTFVDNVNQLNSIVEKLKEKVQYSPEEENKNSEEESF
ncbi:MAG: hypothetical protein QXR30_02325 [Candidatus Woesearchaeota archaeon]